MLYRKDCSNCGRVIFYTHQSTQIKRCDFCGNIIHRNNSTGQTLIVPELTKTPAHALLNKSITALGKKYTLTGFIRYHYTEGYMNLWSAYNENNYFWLGESLAVYFLLGQAEIVPAELSTMGHKRTEDNIIYKSDEYYIDAISTVHSYSLVGELPDFPYLYTDFDTIECSNEKNLLMINCYSNDYQELMKGTLVKPQQIGL